MLLFVTADVIILNPSDDGKADRTLPDYAASYLREEYICFQ
jgi:hypothetical protein